MPSVEPAEGGEEGDGGGGEVHYEMRDGGGDGEGR